MIKAWLKQGLKTYHLVLNPELFVSSKLEWNIQTQIEKPHVKNFIEEIKVFVGEIK